MTAEEARVVTQELASVCRGAWSAERVQVYRGVLAESGIDAPTMRRALRQLMRELPPDDITPSELIRAGRKLAPVRQALEDHRDSGTIVPREEGIRRWREIRERIERAHGVKLEPDWTREGRK